MPLEPIHSPALVQEAAAAADAQARRRAVAERLAQHRRRREGQAALPGIAVESVAQRAAAKPNRVADSVAARFAKSQSYRDFLQEEAETATRQAEAAAEIARRNADAIAAAQQQLLDEMRAWEERQFAPEPASHDAAPHHAAVLPAPATPPVTASIAGTSASGVPLPAVTSPEAGVLLSMAAAPIAAQDFSVLAPSEALRDAASAAGDAASLQTVDGTGPVSARTVEAPVAAVPVPHAVRTPETLFGVRLADAPAVESFAAAPVQEPVEPTTPIPANLIEFPRQLVAARKARPRLAEGPLREDADLAPERAQLRIFEVEASTFSSTAVAEPAASLPEWSTIRLESTTAPHETSQPDAQVSLALPVYAAPLERRVMAAAVDGCCVGTAFLLAVAAAGLAGDALPTGLFAVGASAVTLLLFGIGYLLLCFTLSGGTVGMRYARIALCTFGDDNPSRSAMRRRLFATALSAVSLGLGFAWAVLDDDGLGWHDRISRMYQRAY